MFDFKVLRTAKWPPLVSDQPRHELSGFRFRQAQPELTSHSAVERVREG